MATAEIQVVGVTQDPSTGWYRIQTNHPTLKRVDSKDPEHARQAYELMTSGEVFVLDYNHVEKPRPGGGVYHNYYWNQIVTAAAKPPMPDIPIESARPTDKGDAWRICLSLGAKLALQTLPMIERPEDKTFPAQTDLAYAWGYWLYTTPQPTAGASRTVAASNGPGGPGAYSEYDGPPAHNDDDFPF